MDSVEVKNGNKKGFKRGLDEKIDPLAKRIKTKKDNCKSLIIKEQWLAEKENIDLDVSRNLIALFDEDNTIPFIARYRQHLTNEMGPEKLRHVKEALDTINEVEHKAETLLKTLAKDGPIDGELQNRIIGSTSLEEIELLSTAFKKGSKGTLVARAREAGLEESGIVILNGDSEISLEELVRKDIPGREDVAKVSAGLEHIIADSLAKNTEVLEFIKKLKVRESIRLACSLKKKDTKCEKYDLYKEFNQDVRYIKEHQVLAINRAEAQKVLNVKIAFSDSFWDKVKTFCRTKWLYKGKYYEVRTTLFEKAVDSAIHRLLAPLVSRQVRKDLTGMAERSAINVFSTNLKQLLLQPPLRGKVVMAIDPGVRNGCKIAVVSEVGQPLAMDKIYLTDEFSRKTAADKIVDLIKKHQCETIAVGNGTYCRETESFLSKLIQAGRFRPLDISYAIVDEQGVSIYSCSPAASVEFPNTDPNLISAVSLARRLQDPLAELVKVEPKHLGVGMYQHDIPEKKLTTSLDEIVSECVSFVGVDLNVASLHLLRYVAGLTKSRAEAIVAWRASTGSFCSREELLKIKGIGYKTYQQCAGFLRILPSTAFSGKTVKKKLNPMDQTEIHPDDYSLAERILKKFKIEVKNVGTSDAIEGVKRSTAGNDISELAKEFGVSEPQLKQLLEALKRPPDHDLRNLSEAPLFRKGITMFDSLKPGDRLSGVVRNVVQFGAFVDVGVGHDGLIHSSQLGREKSKWVQLGDKVDVVVISVDYKTKRLSLTLVKK